MDDTGLKSTYRNLYLSLLQINSIFGFQRVFKSTLPEIIRYSGQMTNKEFAEGLDYLEKGGYINYVAPVKKTDSFEINVLKLTAEKKKKAEKVEDVGWDPNSLPCRLMNHIKTNYPRVAQMTTQLSYKNAETLLSKHHPILINEVLTAMENTENLYKYNSVSLTVNNWCNIRKGSGWKAPVKQQETETKSFIKAPKSIATE